MKLRLFCSLLELGMMNAQYLPAQDLKSRLQDQHASGAAAAHWIYNDLDAAMVAARKADKPIFVTFRCVPCKACESFDAEVARGSERITKLARESFIPLRIVEMKSVPLDLFRFDHDLNWAAMFISADGVIYGRYGTQSSKGPDAYNSIDSLEAAMRRVLVLHKNVDRYRAALAGKQPGPTDYKTALDMPGMRNREKLKRPTERSNCIHCHMIHDAENRQWVNENNWSVERLWRFPHPEVIGLKIHADDGRRIDDVLAESVAAKAGMRAGEEIRLVNGQPMISIADMQWVLHNLGNGAGTLSIKTDKDSYELSLPANWKQLTDWAWRGSVWSSPPVLRTWAPHLTSEQKKARGLSENQLALLVKWINRKEKGGREVFKAGIREGDVILAIGDRSDNMTTREFQAHLKTTCKIGDSIELKILRGKKEMTFSVPLVE